MISYPYSTSCFLFYGILIGKNSYHRLVSSSFYLQNEIQIKSFVKQVMKERWILYLPTSWYLFNSYESLIEKQVEEEGEKEIQEYLLQSEIEPLIIKEETKTKNTTTSFFKLKDKQNLLFLQEIIQNSCPSSLLVSPLPKWFYMEGLCDLFSKDYLYPFYYLQHKYEILI